MSRNKNIQYIIKIDRKYVKNIYLKRNIIIRNRIAKQQRGNVGNRGYWVGGGEERKILRTGGRLLAQSWPKIKDDI